MVPRTMVLTMLLTAGKPAPKLILKEHVEAMRREYFPDPHLLSSIFDSCQIERAKRTEKLITSIAGSVIVDLAGEAGKSNFSWADRT